MLRSLVLPQTVLLLAACDGCALKLSAGTAAPDFSPGRFGGSTVRFPDNSCNWLAISVAKLAGISTARGDKKPAITLKNVDETTFDRLAGQLPQ
jgi:hypothetical protein